METTSKVLSLDQFRAIEWHTNEMIAAASAALLKWRQVPPPQRDTQVLNQLTYWRNVISGLKWQLGVAKQRCPACRNV